ncbi:hypothetical protein M8818_000145 [Zalaria obscura]|uniref:Uncharacterized protein n=1 Tax=Zalaria obscura TaxID=2024903 RepID=A0ACC3SPA1_9PEZI
MLLPSKRPPGRLKSLLVKPDFPCIVVTLLTMTLATLITAALVLRYATADSGYGTFSTSQGPVCIVPINHGGDSAPAIVSAFNRCGRNSAGRGTVVFQNTTYTIKTVMETLNLENVDIDLQGTLSWDNSNITYWLDNSTPKDQPGQHGAAWWFGGKNVNWIGHGYGTLNGNGQAWKSLVLGVPGFQTHGQSRYQSKSRSSFWGCNSLVVLDRCARTCTQSRNDRFTGLEELGNLT